MFLFWLKPRRRCAFSLIPVASLRSRAMAIRARVRLLQSMAERGHIMRMHFSYNAVTSTEKVKVVVEPDVVEVAVQQRSILHTFLNVLEERVQTCVTTDRGHVH